MINFIFAINTVCSFCLLTGIICQKMYALYNFVFSYFLITQSYVFSLFIVM
jgi:hypothetical protein